VAATAKCGGTTEDCNAKSDGYNTPSKNITRGASPAPILQIQVTSIHHSTTSTSCSEFACSGNQGALCGQCCRFDNFLPVKFCFLPPRTILSSNLPVLESDCFKARLLNSKSQLRDMLLVIRLNKHFIAGAKYFHTMT